MYYIQKVRRIKSDYKNVFEQIISIKMLFQLCIGNDEKESVRGRN